MDRREFVAAALAACALGAAGKARAVPLTVTRYGLPFMPVTVGGIDTLALVDTGGGRGVQVSQALAGRLGLTGVENGDISRRLDGSQRRVATAIVPSFAAGGRRSADQEVSILEGDIERIAGQVGTAFDVILGWPFLKGAPFTIDYRGSDMAMPAAAPAGAPALVVPLQLGARAPLASATIDGIARTVLIDTGAPMSNLDPSLAGSAALNDVVSKPVSMGGGAAIDLPFRVKNLAAIRQGLGAEAVIGHNLLSRYRVHYDAAENRLLLFG
jgi:hypothetical protein